MCTRVYDFLSNTNQIYESQYGLRAKQSCEHAIGELVSEITKSMEWGKHTVSAFLDLSKAFDTLEHSVIFKKFERYGLRGPCLEWFKSYLYGRTLRVRCNTSNALRGPTICRQYHIIPKPQKNIGYLRFCFKTDLANIQDWFNAR